MAQTTPLTPALRVASPHASILPVRIALILVLLAGWEALARSGLLFQDVVPSWFAIGDALWSLLSSTQFYSNLWITAVEVGVALAIGGGLGLLCGLALGGSRFLSRSYERGLYYLGPTPKIIFFPVMIMWFGVGSGSKIAMGAVSCFFPIALSTAAGMREIDAVLIRVGRSFRASPRQMIAKIYLPAMRAPILNGMRLGFGVAVIGVLLAETRLSNRGLGFLVIQNYNQFNMPRMYALLIVIFLIAVAVNGLIDRCGSPPRSNGMPGAGRA